MSELFSLAEASLTLADFVEEFETEYGCGLLSCVSVDDRRDPAGQWRLFIEPWDDESAAHAIGLLDSLEGGVPFTLNGRRWYRAIGEYREFKDSSPSDAASLVGLGAVGGDRTGGGGSLPIPSPCMPCERPGSGSISTGAAPRASSSPVSRPAPEACERFQPVGEEAFEEVERLLVRASVLLGRAAGLLKRERSGR